MHSNDKTSTDEASYLPKRNNDTDFDTKRFEQKGTALSISSFESNQHLSPKLFASNQIITDIFN